MQREVSLRSSTCDCGSQTKLSIRRMDVTDIKSDAKVAFGNGFPDFGQYGAETFGMMLFSLAGLCDAGLKSRIKEPDINISLPRST